MKLVLGFHRLCIDPPKNMKELIEVTKANIAPEPPSFHFGYIEQGVDVNEEDDLFGAYWIAKGSNPPCLKILIFIDSEEDEEE